MNPIRRPSRTARSMSPAASAWRAAMTATLLAGLAACGSSPMPPAAPSGVAALQSKSGSSVTGTVRFAQVADGVRVSVSIGGLKPNGEHGFHVHEKGDCSSPDGMSAGGHYNPGGHPHGPQGSAHHAGDMPSLKADANGKVETTFLLTGVSVGSGPANLMGKGVIVHAEPDDYKTQPTGNAGGRWACGVIM